MAVLSSPGAYDAESSVLFASGVVGCSCKSGPLKTGGLQCGNGHAKHLMLRARIILPPLGYQLRAPHFASRLL